MGRNESEHISELKATVNSENYVSVLSGMKQRSLMRKHATMHKCIQKIKATN